MHYICVGCSLVRSQGCMFGHDPFEIKDGPEGIPRILSSKSGIQDTWKDSLWAPYVVSLSPTALTH